MKPGFSLIEIILVVGLLLVLAAITVPISGSWFLSNQLHTTTSILVSSIRKAQTYAQANKNNQTWGICLTGSVLRLFSSSCASPVIKDDYTLPSSITITGLSTVTFSSLRGEPSLPQFITISDSGTSKTVTINSVGGIIQN